MAINQSNSFFSELKSGFENGKLSRRSFLRYATLLGICGTATYRIKDLLSPPKAGAAVLRPKETIRVATSIPGFTDPAQLQCIENANILRNIAEYLTVTDRDEITHPYLLKSWQVSKDFKTWTLNVRKGIRFNNGDPFTADDVVFSMNHWLKKDSRSSLYRIMGGYLDTGGIEKTNTYQVKLHLKVPEIAVPEHLFHHTAVILNHKTFEDDFFKAPHGTGPFTLNAYSENNYALLKRRHDYWQKLTLGDTSPCTDVIEFVDMGAEGFKHFKALGAPEIDMIDMATSGGKAAFVALNNCQKVHIKPFGTGQHRILRIPVDAKPWSDQRVRRALELCQRSQQIFSPAYFFQRMQGHTFLAGPVYSKIIKKGLHSYPPKKARRLLHEAGYPNGLDVKLTVNSSTDSLCYANTLKEDARPAGFNIKVQSIPTDKYWEKWLEADLNVSPWIHQPLSPMTLNQVDIAAYAGTPVSWIGVLMAVCPKIA